MTKPEASSEPRQLLDAAIAISAEAAQAIMEVYKSDFAVQSKSDRTPLTQADMRAHKIICAGLGELDDTIPVLSEESAAVPYDERRKWQRYWLVDPLDGTREFIKRNGEFTVNIALVEEHRPVLGVVAVPATGLVYYACAGHGAFRKGTAGAALPAAVPTADPSRRVLSPSWADKPRLSP